MIPTIDELDKKWTKEANINGSSEPMTVFFSHGFDILRQGKVIVSIRY